jgi:carboxylate-amine ligase
MSVAEEPLDLLAEYRREPRGYDEAVDEQGRPRASHEGALRALVGRDLQALAGTVDEQVAGEGVCFHSAVGDEAFLIDPVPRVIDAGEWEAIEAGLRQRARALNAFVADVYADRRIVDAGVVPERVIDTAEYHEPAMNGVRPPGDIWIGIAGLDLVRDAKGHFQVLEDNVRTPSGYSYAAAARRALSAQLDVPPADAPRPLDDLPALLAFALEAAAPTPGRSRIALLTDGPDNAAYYEHEWAAEAIGVPLVEPEELAARDDIDIVYRRTNADRLDTPVGRMLLDPVRNGQIAVVNAFGTGVADDKLTHAYVEDMIRFYLDEEPLLPSVETFDLGRPEILERAMDVFGELVVKPRGGYGGEGVAILPHAEPWDVDAVREAVLAAPTAYVAQRMVMLSSHPTVVDGKLASRHVDLRPYVFLGRDGEARVAPGGLTRVALDEGALVVNSSQNGGAKDTWVLTG